MTDRTELLEALKEDSAARWSLTVIASTMMLIMLELVNAPRGIALGVVAIVAALGSVGLPLRWRLTCGVVAWALLTGFVYNRFGVLTFTKPDLTRMLILVGAASVATPLLGPRRTNQ
jgi:hypothetical protein